VEVQRLDRCVGRDTELADLLDVAIVGIHDGGRSVVVRGPAGIGKTAVLERLGTDARRAIDGLRVIRIDGIVSEAQLPLAALTLLTWRLRQLQRSPGGAVQHLAGLLDTGHVDEPVLDNATLQALGETAQLAPLLLIIDAAQWVDPVSARSLAFALRRLDQDRIVAIIGSRDDHSTPFDHAGFEQRRLGGVGVDHAAALLGVHFGAGVVAAEVSETCARRTGGNPLAMVEVAGSIDSDQRSGRRSLPSVLPVGSRVIEAVGAKISELEPGDQIALAVLAAGEQQPVAVASALDEVGGAARLAPSIRAGIVVDTDHGPAFAHPLYGQAVLEIVDADDVRRAHRALASALGADPRAAWHLADATIGADDDVAELMDELGGTYQSRGDPALAARAFERSAQLSTDEFFRFGRRVKAGRSLWEASQPLVAIEVLSALLADASGPDQRAVIAGDLGDALAWRRTVGEGIGLMIRAAADIEASDPDQASVLYLRTSLLHGLAGDCDEEFAVAQRAVELAEVGGGPLVVAARLVRGLGAQMSGRREIADDDLSLAPLLLGLPADSIDSTVALVFQAMGVAQMAREHHDEARRCFERVVAAGEVLGQSGVVGFTNACLSEIAFRRGRFVDAIIAGSSDVRSHDPRPHHTDAGGTRDPRTDEIGSFGHATFARAAAVTGRIDEAVAEALVARRTGDAIDMRGLSAWARAAHGLACLAANDPVRASVAMREARLLVDGWIEPSLLWHHGDLFEALAMIGADDEVDALADELALRCAATGTQYGAAIAARHRRIEPSGQRRRRDRADVDAIRWSIDVFDRLDAPFERARSLAALAAATSGDGAAREAAAEFDRLGATAWADRARAIVLSVERPSGSSREGGLSLLTSAELRVSEAVSRGLTNRDIASELFISPKTVEYHLRNIFRKLHIARRAELVARFHTAGSFES
jgi:DNA-binding CsgD family transcriptional regulator